MQHHATTLPTTRCGSAVALLAVLASTPSPGLAQGSPERLEEVVVTSSLIEMPRRRLGTAVSVVGADEIELRGYSSLSEVLRTQPGIGVSNSGGLGKTTLLRIRGEEPYRTQLIIDGVKAVDPSAPQVLPSFESLVTTNDLRRIEVLRGPQGFLYGADAGGVVNVLTLSGDGPAAGRVDAEYGAFGTRRLGANVSGGGAAGDYFVSATKLETDGFNAQTADTVLADDDGAENTTLHAKLGLEPTEALRLELVARDIEAWNRYDGCFSSATFTTVHDCTGTTNQMTYRLAAEHTGETLGNRVSYSAVDIAREDLAAGADAFASEGELERLEYTGSYTPAEAVSFVYGLDLQSEHVLSDGELLERDQHGVYFEYQGQLGDALHLTAGARHDDNEDFGEHTSWRVSAARVQRLGGGDALKYRLSYGTGFRAPSLYEIAYNAGPFAFPPAADVTLTEESSRGYDIGIEYDTIRGLHAEATWFDQRIEDELFFDLAGFSGYLQSAGESRSRGIELAARAPVGERFELIGNWTWNETRSTANEQRLRRPEHYGNFGVSYRALNDSLRLIANLRVSMDSVDVGNVVLDDYEVLDLSMGYTLSETLELNARLENATDEDYEELIGFNSAGRAAYAGVRLRF